MKSTTLFLVTIITILSFASCSQKRIVLDLDLKNDDPTLVAYGGISDQAGPYIFNLSETIDLDQSNVFPKISGATITLEDNMGGSEVLNETTPGQYETVSIQGTPGRTYSLNIKHNGKEYNSSVKMPSASITIDSLFLEKVNTPIGELDLIGTVFNDQAGEDNFYYIQYFVNGTESDSSSELITDGNGIVENGKILLYSEKDEVNENFVPGDTLTVQVQSIDVSMYNYYKNVRALEEGGGGGIGSASTPDNPISNITGGAIGFFSAHTIARKTIVIQ